MQYYGFITNLYKEKGCCVDRIVEGVIWEVVRVYLEVVRI